MNLKEAHAELRTFIPKGWLNIRSDFWEYDNGEVEFEWVIQTAGPSPRFKSLQLATAVAMCRNHFQITTVEQASAQLEEAHAE